MNKKWAFLQPKHKATLLGFSLFLFVSLATQASSPKEELYYQMKIPSLHYFKKESTQQLSGKPSLWVLFQDNCPSCEKQLSDLNCLNKDLQKVAVGFWGPKTRLQRVIRKTQFEGLSLKADRSSAAFLGLKQTPTLLLIDDEGHLVQKMEQRLPCEKLHSFIKTKIKKRTRR